MKHKLCLILIGLVSLVTSVLGLAPTLSTEKEQTDVDVYKVVGLQGGTQYLPASYVNAFSRWQLDASGKLVAMSTEECSVEKESGATEITMNIQPTINFLLKGGVPTYIFAGLWVHDGQNKQISGEANHLAQQWTTFSQAAKSNFRVEVFMGQGDGSNDRRLGVVDAPQIDQALEQLGTALSITNAKDLGNGFHIVTIPLKMMGMEDLDMARGKSGTMIMTCIATAEPEALKLLSLDNESLENTATSKLNVEAFKILSVA